MKAIWIGSKTVNFSEKQLEFKDKKIARIQEELKENAGLLSDR
jgi:hypothetical protein